MRKKVALLLGVVSVVVLITGCRRGNGNSFFSKSDNGSVQVMEDMNSEDENSSEVSIADEQVFTLREQEPLEINGQQIFYHFVAEDVDSFEGKACISYGDQEIELDSCEWLIDSYVITTSDSEFIVLAQLGYSNDWCQTVGVKYSVDFGLTVFGKEWGYVESEYTLNSTTCYISSRVDILGTYSTIIEYSIADTGFYPQNMDGYVSFNNENIVNDGSFLDGLSEDNYTIKIFDENGRKKLILKSNLTLYTDGGSEILNAGSVVYPIGFNESSGRFYVEINGEEGYFNYQKNEDEFIITVDGIDQYDAFEELPYAG